MINCPFFYPTMHQKRIIIAKTSICDKAYNMWCDLGETVGSWTCDTFSFLFDWSHHNERYILLKTPYESDQWFQSYISWKILKTIENIEMHSGLYLTINATDFRLTPLDRNTYMWLNILKGTSCLKTGILSYGDAKSK